MFVKLIRFVCVVLEPVDLSKRKRSEIQGPYSAHTLYSCWAWFWEEHHCIWYLSPTLGSSFTTAPISQMFAISELFLAIESRLFSFKLSYQLLRQLCTDLDWPSFCSHQGYHQAWLHDSCCDQTPKQFYVLLPSGTWLLQSLRWDIIFCNVTWVQLFNCNPIQ